MSVIKRNAWNCHLKKYTVPCRKYSIILKGYSSISSCSFRDHSAACLYASFLEKDAIYYIIFVHSFEKRVVFLAQKKITQTEPPPPENRKLGLAVQEIWRKHFQGKTTPIDRRYNKQNHQKNTKTEKKNKQNKKNKDPATMSPPTFLWNLWFFWFSWFFRFSVMDFNFV